MTMEGMCLSGFNRGGSVICWSINYDLL